MMARSAGSTSWPSSSRDRKSTRLNSSHPSISYAVFCLKKISKKTGRREFKRGILSYSCERWEVRTTGPQGSGILTSMTLAHCFVVIEEELRDVSEGDNVSVRPFAAC